MEFLKRPLLFILLAFFASTYVHAIDLEHHDDFMEEGELELKFSTGARSVEIDYADERLELDDADGEIEIDDTSLVSNLMINYGISSDINIFGGVSGVVASLDEEIQILDNESKVELKPGVFDPTLGIRFRIRNYPTASLNLGLMGKFKTYTYVEPLKNRAGRLYSGQSEYTFFTESIVALGTLLFKGRVNAHFFQSQKRQFAFDQSVFRSESSKATSFVFSILFHPTPTLLIELGGGVQTFDERSFKSSEGAIIQDQNLSSNGYLRILYSQYYRSYGDFGIVLRGGNDLSRVKTRGTKVYDYRKKSFQVELEWVIELDTND